MSTRPEHTSGGAEDYYDATEAKKYTERSRVVKIQTALAERALELLNFPDDDTPRVILDIGCGSGLSGNVLTEAGHWWVGLDISKDMLGVALENEVAGDLLLADMGHGFGFRPGMFDGVISVSALQWLCYSSKKNDVAHKRVVRFFHALYRALRRGGRAALQLYPETPEQLEMVTTAAMSCGFSGGVVVDFPHSTKAKKIFLCLFAGSDGAVPEAKGGAAGGAGAGAGGVDYKRRRKTIYGKGKHKGLKAGAKTKDWVLLKKEQQRKKGINVRRDTKYTARKRKDKF